MNIKIIAFGIAKDILNDREIEFSIDSGDTIANLKTKLVTSYPSFSSLSSLAFAVNEEYCSDDYVIQPTDNVVIIPPVAGG